MADQDSIPYEDEDEQQDADVDDETRTQTNNKTTPPETTTHPTEQSHLVHLLLFQ